MKLSQKIKHIKRHRANKRFAKFADSFHFAAAKCFLDGNENVFIVSPRLYSIMENRKGCIPKNIKQSPLNCDRQIIAVPKDIIEFYNDNELDYIKEWCGIPNLHKETANQLNNIPLGQFVNPELYCNMGVVKPNSPLSGDIKLW